MSLRPNKSTKLNFLGAVLMLTLLAGVFCYLAGFGRVAQLTEMPGLVSAANNSEGMAPALLNGPRSPLYYMMLTGWRTLFGSGTESTRFFSLVGYLGCVLALYLATSSVYGKGTGLFATLLACISPFLQWLGFEATVYSLLMFLSTINLYFFILLLKSDCSHRPVWVGYGMTALLGISAHPIFAWLLFFELTTLFLHLRAKTRIRRERIVLVSAILAAVIALWMTPQLLQVAAFDRWITPLVPESRAQQFSNAFVVLFFGFQGSATSTLIAAMVPLTILASFAWLSFPSNLSRLTVCVVSVTLGPLVLLALVDLFVHPLPLSRYWVIIVPALYALIARGIDSFPRPYSQISGGVLIAAMLCGLARQALYHRLPANQDYRGVSRYLARQVGSNDVILVTSPYVVFPIEYYYGRKITIQTIPVWDRSDAASIPGFDDTALRNQVVGFLERKDRCWLVLGCDQGDERTIENFFNGSFRRLEYREFSPGLRLAAFRAERPVQDLIHVNARKAGLDPLYGVRLYVNPDSAAKRQAKEWMETRPQNAALMEKIAAQPMAFWLVRKNRAVVPDVKQIMAAAEPEKALPCFVTYFFPERDRGGFSAGGAQDSKEYLNWIQAIADAIGDRKAIVILEPDTLGLTVSMPEMEKEKRLMLLRKAVHIFSQKTRVLSYIDAGHCNWVGPTEMAQLLRRVGIGSARGFALNVSNFYRNIDVIAYGNKISKLLDGKPFVIDTSRNGLGATNQVFNPAGRALGLPPSLQTGHALVDAFLWIKNPGESDGTANGGPIAGQWWAEYALGLAERAQW